MKANLLPTTLKAAIREFLDGLAELIAQDMLRRQEEGQSDARDGTSLSARKKRSRPMAWGEGERRSTI